MRRRKDYPDWQEQPSRKWLCRAGPGRPRVQLELSRLWVDSDPCVQKESRWKFPTTCPGMMCTNSMRCKFQRKVVLRKYQAGKAQELYLQTPSIFSVFAFAFHCLVVVARTYLWVGTGPPKYLTKNEKHKKRNLLAARISTYNFLVRLYPSLSAESRGK